MKRTMLFSALALVAIVALGLSGCSGKGEADPEDAGKPVGVIGGETPESVDDLGALPDDTGIPVGAVVKGRVVDSNEAPIPTPFLVLCGLVGGKSVCNNMKGESDGTFTYVGLSTGYDHLQVMAYQAELLTGQPYSGANVIVEVASEDDVIDLGDIRIPIVTNLQEMDSSQGGTVAFHGLELEVGADGLLFPSGEDVGNVGIEDVPTGDMPFHSEGVYKAFAFYPFPGLLFPEGTLRVKLSEIDWAGSAPTGVTLLFNSMEYGGFTPIDFTVEDGVMTTTLTDLTWIGLGDCGTFDVPVENCVEL